MNALQIIQQKLKAPKSCYNSFGKYSYRNQEDILEAVKPLLAETDSILLITDEVVEVGGSLFIKSTAQLSWKEKDKPVATEVTAFAEHAKQQSGMNPAQITGSASSYARKYALNGLFLIDDAKDADATNTHGKEEEKAKKPAPTKAPAKAPAKNSAKEESPKPTVEKKPLTLESKSYPSVVAKIKGGVKLETIKGFFTLTEEVEKKLIEDSKAETNETK